MNNGEERDMSIHPEVADDKLVLYVKKGKFDHSLYPRFRANDRLLFSQPDIHCQLCQAINDDRGPLHPPLDPHNRVYFERDMVPCRKPVQNGPRHGGLRRVHDGRWFYFSSQRF